ncbi:MAG: response regulator [Burkholderiaceae bacterium]
MAEILVVDDEIGIRELLSEILGDEGHVVLVADSAAQAREIRESNNVDLVLLDIWMPDTDGVTLLKEWATTGQLTMPVIMMSGHATIDTAVEATRIGALDFLEKPITLQKLLSAVQAGLQRNRAPNPAQIANGMYQRPYPPVAGNTGRPTQLQPATMGAAAAVVATQTVGHSGAGLQPVAGTMPSAYMPGQQDPQLYGNPNLPHSRPGFVAAFDLPLDIPLREARDAFERVYFEHHLTREHGSMTRVAEKTGLERTHLYRKLKQLGIDLARGAYRNRG